MVFCDNTTINLYKILGYAWQLDRTRPVIVTEAYNFPTDMYVAEGLARFAGGGAAVRRIDEPRELDAALTGDVGVLYLSHVDYRSSRRWNMAEVNELARARGVLTVWDCSHAAGAVPVDLGGAGADFAVGCGYKYLCGGPGAPAWLYVHPRHQDRAWPVIAGWMGHADVFAFAPTYEPLPDVRRHLTGTPGIIANEAMSAAVDIWRDVKREDLSWKHRSLSELTIALLEQECGKFGVRVTSPRKYDEQGGHVGFSHPGAGSVCEALLEHGVVSSFRKPDVIRFGISPVAISHEDVWVAVARAASGARDRGLARAAIREGVGLMRARLAADIGGTFTDVVLESPAGRDTAKVLTTPAPEVGVLEGVRRVLAAAGLPPSEVSVFVHGTTLATNALIERKGARTAFVTTEGMRDILEMGYEKRFEQYDVYMERPLPLVPRPLRFTVPGRRDGRGRVLRELDEAAVRAVGERLRAERVEAVAIGFMHAYAWPQHEQRAAEILRARAAGRRHRLPLERGLSGDPRVRALLDDLRQRVRAADDAGLPAAAARRAGCARHDVPAAAHDVGRRAHHARDRGPLSGAARRVRARRRRLALVLDRARARPRARACPSTWAARPRRSASSTRASPSGRARSRSRAPIAT